MNKKEITTLIVTGVLVFLVAIFGCYSLAKAPSDDSNDTPNSSANSKDSVKAGNYTLRYGNYAGTSTEYDPDTNKTTSSETIIILASIVFTGKWINVTDDNGIFSCSNVPKWHIIFDKYAKMAYYNQHEYYIDKRSQNQSQPNSTPGSKLRWYSLAKYL